MKAITLEINDHRKIFAIKELFGNEFRNLKLEFYAKPHTEDGPHSDKIVRNSAFTIGECRTVRHNGTLVVHPAMTAGELADYLREVYGLKAIVFKRSGLAGQAWVTAPENGISLEELNRETATTA